MTTQDELVDSFAVLGLPRTAALDEEDLLHAYTKRSRDAHPDHGGSEADASRVNAAYETLRQPDKRLKHLLELAGPAEAKAWRTVPLDDAMMQLFSRLGAVMDASARFLVRKAAAASALAKALLACEEMLHRESLEQIGFEIEAKKTELVSGLAALDAATASGSAGAWKDLAALQARLAYLGKWQAQVRERLLALM